jgi:hypothetical protein
MIVLLDDADVIQMIQKKSNNENPEDVIAERIDSYRIQYEF